MTSCSRWIAVCVDVFDHSVVGMALPPPKPADPSRHAQSPALAWLDLIASAAWARKTIPHKNASVTLERGQFMSGRAYWAKRWNWGEQAVRSFFSKLCSCGMVAICNQSNGHLANVASICNYDTYQSAKADTQPVQKPEPNQSLTRGQPEGNQTVPRDTIVTIIDPPVLSARAREPEVEIETEADRKAREAYERGLAIKGGAVAKSARATQRAKGELDGSQGVTFTGGKLTVVNGAAAELLAEFPGVDLKVVCNRAGPDVARLSYPTRDDAMATLRKWAEIVSDDKPARKRSEPSETQFERTMRLCQEASDRMGLETAGGGRLL